MRASLEQAIAEGINESNIVAHIDQYDLVNLQDILQKLVNDIADKLPDCFAALESERDELRVAVQRVVNLFGGPADVQKHGLDYWLTAIEKTYLKIRDDAGSLCGKDARIKELEIENDGLNHERNLIKADVHGFTTDCSTPVFQCVRNAIDRITELEEALGHIANEPWYIGADREDCMEIVNIASNVLGDVEPKPMSCREMMTWPVAARREVMRMQVELEAALKRDPETGEEVDDE